MLLLSPISAIITSPLYQCAKAVIEPLKNRHMAET